MNIDLKLINKISSFKKPAIVAISGFGGSGKSTFAKLLSDKINSPVVSIDTFNKRVEKYTEWNLFDYDRLVKDAIKPFLDNKPVIEYKSDSGEGLVENLSIPNTGILIIEGVGLLRPSLMSYFNYSIWIDCPIDNAVKRGKKRDREVWNNPKDELWDGIWKDNDLECFQKFKPDKLADLIINNS